MQIGIAVDNSLPLHIPSFAQFVGVHSKKLRCRAVNAPFRFSGAAIDYEAAVRKLSVGMRRELAGNDLSLLVTAIPFENNFFYEGLDHLDWQLLTTLPMSNGLAYLLCQIISKHEFGIGSNHEQNRGCINDFWWDKTGIDVGMRAAFLCDECRAHSENSPHLASQEFSDISSILNAI